MKLGAFLPPWGPAATPGDFVTTARAAEELGYVTLWIGDHVVFPADVVSRYPYNPTGDFPFDRAAPLYEPMTLLAYLAGRTEHIGLGVSVLVLPMRNPVEAAKQLSNVDALSGGRLRLGVGVGWLREEFEALGADFEQRGSVMDEWIGILRELWAPGPPRPFDGRHRRVAALAFEPKPERRIPIVIGGNSRIAMRRAVRVGDGWHLVRLGPDEVLAARGEVSHLLADAGRDLSAFDLQLRTAIPLERASNLLRRYAEAGLDELIVEVPNVDTQTRIEHLRVIAVS